MSNAGITYLIYGRDEFPPQVVLPVAAEPIELEGVVRVLGDRSLIQSGRGVGPAGDYNGDGFADFLVGSQNPDPFEPGKMAAILGGPDLPPLIELDHLGGHGFRIDGIHRITKLEESTKFPGDLNGDGVLDFAFSEWSAPSFPDGGRAPGSVHVIFGLPANIAFIRGDVNTDAAINIADPQYLLNFLFLGGLSPLCNDATDANDDGQANIADAQYLLNHLFLGGPEPPAPYPEPGSDPTVDDFDCRGF